MNTNDFKHIYCIGIGGIGLSALARMFRHQGKTVSGSDQSESLVTEELGKIGVHIHIGADPSHIPADTDLVVYTIALPNNHPELVEAGKRGIPTKTYPEMLGILSKHMKTIAVSGTHGKTTTTAMITDMLIDCGASPTAIVGSLLRKHNSNFIPGTSDIFVVEACEYRRSFLNIQPHILVITNIDADHLDYYKDIADIQSAFRELAEKMTEQDFIIAEKDNPTIMPVLEHVRAQIVDPGHIFESLSLRVPGKHNRDNARKALAVGNILNIPIASMQRSLETFEGTWRRFEKKGETASGATVFDDYAHHPTEIRATLAAARETFPDKKIFAIFQPHLYSRTKTLLDDFADSFADADMVIIAPIYAAREVEDASISNDILARKIVEKGVSADALHSFGDMRDFIQSHAGQDSLVITLGAGDVYKVAEMVLADSRL